MKEKVITINDLERENRLRDEVKVWFKDKYSNVSNCISRNKDLILLLGPATLSAVTVGIKTVSKHMSQKKEENLKELYCYDRSLGHYWKLRRELTNSEWIDIDKRKRNGERLADILDELKVLK